MREIVVFVVVPLRRLAASQPSVLLLLEAAVAMPGAPLSSLVKYETPSLLTTKSKGAKGAKGGKKLPPVEAKQPLTQTEDILNSILPPRYAPERL